MAGSPPRHLLGLRGVPPDRLRTLLAAADRYADTAEPAPVLAGRTVATLFFEPSTRTRTSFAVAAQRLGARCIDLTPESSSLKKGESLVDTALTVEAMGVDAVIVRTRQAGGPRLVADALRCPVVNAGDGRHEHPTQALTDALAIARASGRTEGFDFAGLRVAIVGDAANSRVARSDVAALAALGADVVLVGPAVFAPESLRAIGCRVARDLDAELPACDAVIVLRVQFERHDGTPPVITQRAYREACALTEARARLMKPGAVVMHPGPMNRGLEIDGVVADALDSPGLPKALIREQVRLGVAVRMAALAALVAPADPSRPRLQAEEARP